MTEVPEQPESPAARDPRLRFIAPVLAYGDMMMTLLGERTRFPPARLISLAGQYSWESMFLKLARLASAIANAPGGATGAEARAWTTDLLGSRLESGNAEERVVAFYVGLKQPCIVAHEEAIYFAQALAILYGLDAGPEPSDGVVAFMLLGVNDHCFDWKDEREGITELERVMIATARSLLFNHNRDDRASLVRANRLLKAPPPRTPAWRGATDWSNFQRRALGETSSAHLEFLTGPLFMWSTMWGDPSQGSELPVIDRQSWAAETSIPRDLAERYWATASATREDLRASLLQRVTSDGLPCGVSEFYRTPFVRASSGRMVAASPWVVQEQTRGAAWGALLAQAKLEHPNGSKAGAEQWLSAFGDLFEIWCRELTQAAARCSAFKGCLYLSQLPGDADEIEDVVLLDGNRLLLVSAKARAVPEKFMKQAGKASELLDWYHDVFFRQQASSTDPWRGGALRSLSAKIDRVKRGGYEAQGISGAVDIYPMVVMYDFLGADNPVFYRWINQTSAANGILQQPNVRPVAIVDVGVFESVLAFAAGGGDVFELLDRRGSENRVDVTLHEMRPTGEVLTLPWIVAEFEALADGMQKRLFNR